METVFTFGQIDALLAESHHIASDKRTAFTSRLKHFQKLGIPLQRGGASSRPGRGRAGTYTFGQLMQLAVAVEFLQAGLPPAFAAKIVEGNWMSLRATIHLATYNNVELRAFEPPIGETDWLWVLNPEALRDLTVYGLGKYDHYDAVAVVGASEIQSYLLEGAQPGVMGEWWRRLILNGSELTRSIILQIAFHYGYATVEEMRASIRKEYEAEQLALDNAISMLPDSEGWSKAFEHMVDTLGLRGVFPAEEEQKIAAVSEYATQGIDGARRLIPILPVRIISLLHAAKTAEEEAGLAIYVENDMALALSSFGLMLPHKDRMKLTDFGHLVLQQYHEMATHADELSTEAMIDAAEEAKNGDGN